MESASRAPLARAMVITTGVAAEAGIGGDYPAGCAWLFLTLEWKTAEKDRIQARNSVPIERG